MDMETLEEEPAPKVVTNKTFPMPMLVVIGMILPRRPALKREILMLIVIGRRTKKSTPQNY